MKKIVLALAVALMGTIVMNAQPPHRPGMDKGQMLEKRVERLEKELNLTPEQKAEILRIYTEEMETMQQAAPSRGQGFEPGDEDAMKARHEQMQKQRQETNARIEALLTPEQAEKFAQIKDRDGRRGHRPGMGHPGRHDGERPHGSKGQKPDCPGCHCNCADK